MRKIHFTDKYLLSPYHPVTVLVAGAGGTGYQAWHAGAWHYRLWDIRGCT